MEWVGLGWIGRTLKIIQFHHCHGQGHLPLDQDSKPHPTWPLDTVERRAKQNCHVGVFCQKFWSSALLDTPTTIYPRSLRSLPTQIRLWFHVQVLCEFLCWGKPKVDLAARIVRDGHPRHPLFGWMEEVPTSWGWSSTSGDKQVVSQRHLLFHVTESVFSH